MKAYGYDRHTMLTCIYGCCGYTKNPNVQGKRTNVKPYNNRAKKAARQDSKKQIITEI